MFGLGGSACPGSSGSLGSSPCASVVMSIAHVAQFMSWVVTGSSSGTGSVLSGLPS